MTVPARKLLDICKSLPEGSSIKFSAKENKVAVRSGSSRFTLSTLPAREFPNVENSIGTHQLTLKQGQLKRKFAISTEETRYYLNGVYMHVAEGEGGQVLRCVATDGHRLARIDADLPSNGEGEAQVILPRKGVLELARLLMDDVAEIQINIGSNHIRATTEHFTFTSKLVDGKFPDYEKVVPRSANNILKGSRQDLRQAFTRTAILSNEKFRGVRLKLTANTLDIVANNPEQEEAEESLMVDYPVRRLKLALTSVICWTFLGC